MADGDVLGSLLNAVMLVSRTEFNKWHPDLSRILLV